MDAGPSSTSVIIYCFVDRTLSIPETLKLGCEELPCLIENFKHRRKRREENQFYFSFASFIFFFLKKKNRVYYESQPFLKFDVFKDVYP